MATCRCRGYGFPHRKGSGRCYSNEPGPYCGDCGKPAVAVQRDFGIGPFECHGYSGTHRDINTVSECCEAPLFDNASLTIDYIE